MMNPTDTPRQLPLGIADFECLVVAGTRLHLVAMQFRGDVVERMEEIA